jgi:hypothetical protein
LVSQETPSDHLSADPRLTDRRGDLGGFSMLVFTGLVLIGFALAALLLFVVTGPAAAPTPSPTPSPTPTPPPTTPPSPSAAPSATGGPESSPAATVQVGTAAPLMSDGTQVGTVTVLQTRYTRNAAGNAAPAGMRFLIARIRYDATTPLDYDASSWLAIDADGTEHAWRGSGDPAPALESGQLPAGESRAGNVTFEVPRTVAVVALSMRDAEGNESVRVTLR